MIRYAFYFIALSLLCIYGAIRADHFVMVFLLTAFGLCFSGVGLTFATRRPLLLGKTSRGGINFWAYLVYWPYFILNVILLYCVRYSGNSNAYDEIFPRVFLGGRLLESDFPTLFSNSNSYAVLDVTAEFSECKSNRNSKYYRCLPLLDTMAPSIEEIKWATCWIDNQSKERPVYVHCALGNGRSATFIAAYLLKSKKCSTPQDAVNYIKLVRPSVNLNSVQYKSLVEFASLQGN